MIISQPFLVTEQTLADHIVEVLMVATEPLKAKEIAKILSTGSGVTFDSTAVNSILYGVLAPKVVKNEAHRWAIRKAIDDGIVAPAAPLVRSGQESLFEVFEKIEPLSPVERIMAASTTADTILQREATRTKAEQPSSPTKMRLKTVYEFLKELHDLRNPVPRSLDGEQVFQLRDWPKHESIQVREGDFSDTTESAAEAVQYPIRVKRAKLTACPKPPSEIAEWLLVGWEDCSRRVETVEAKNLAGANGKTITEKFGSSVVRTAALARWVAERQAWALVEKPAAYARAVFEELYSTWSRLQKEGGRFELALADGFADVPSESICYPILSRRVELEFDASAPEFLVSLAGDQSELATALLRQVPEVEPKGIARLKKRLEDLPVDPLGGHSTTQFLREAAQSLWRNGEFVSTQSQRPSTTVPVIWRGPVLYVRKKVAGLSSALDGIVEDLMSSASIPAVGLARIVGFDEIQNDSGKSTPGGAPPPGGAEPVDTLFSKPANAEQFRIAAQLAANGAVLVQGPPGTGKTHTIANLLGDLLAQGKTVLVTAHTTKALRVLREKVARPLQPLCLSVLDSEAESKSQLSKSAQEIVAKLSTCDAAQLRREVTILRQKRDDLRAKIESLRLRLRSVRESEIAEIVINGEALRPIDAAKEIKAGVAAHDWIPGPVTRNSLPLNESEIRELYTSNTALALNDEALLGRSRPRSSRLIQPADFAKLAETRRSASTKSAKRRPEYWRARNTGNQTPEKLTKLHEALRQAGKFLSEANDWEREMLYCGWAGGPLSSAWLEIVTAIDSLNLESGEVQRLSMTLLPELPKTIPPEVASTHFSEILGHLENGGSLGFISKLLNAQWHTTIEASKIEGRVPKTAADFRSLKRVADFEQGRQLFRARWEKSVEKYAGPAFDSLGNAPERAAKIHCEKIIYCVNWRENFWQPFVQDLEESGFLWNDWLQSHRVEPGDYAELKRACAACSTALVEMVEAEVARLVEEELQGRANQQANYLKEFQSTLLAAQLLAAHYAWNSAAYTDAFEEVVRLEQLEATYSNRRSRLQTLGAAAENWASSISARIGVHTNGVPPGPVASAWRWRLLIQELEARAAQTASHIQETLRSMEDEVHVTTAEIIEKSTWAAQRERTGLREQQALQGYVQIINKVTKTGRGVRDAELLREARNCLNNARGAVPVWIMPLHRVYESFDPRTTKFDVVIVDEASQSDVTALAALYLGKELIVVGDKEQVTPDAVGQDVGEVGRLIASHLQGVPNSILYDGQTSIYDLAETAFGSVVALREHFRCVPEIIQFSNDLSYNGSILPLREPSSARLRPALVSYRVSGFRVGDGKINEAEAEAIVSLIMACLEHPSYRENENGAPMSFGVISLLGGEQAELIDFRLRQSLSPVVYARHQILCGTAANLQGDERDVVFLSLVDGPPESGLLPTRSAGPRDLYKKRYNVAASRARNQLWVVHSLDPELHLNNGDLRKRLIDHARDPLQLMNRMEQLSKRTESEFEKQVLQRLIRAGYRTATQWRVGSFRIDIVVQGANGKKLAIECDGERWHTAEQLQKDLERQAILERLGWVFRRIRGSLFFRDADAAMIPVFEKLAAMEIDPIADSNYTGTLNESELMNELRARAEGILASRAAGFWSNAEANNGE